MAGTGTGYRRRIVLDLAAKMLTILLHSALLAAPVLPVLDAPAEKRAFEIADYYRTAFPSNPTLSPDGRTAVFTVRRYDLDADESWSELWRLDLSSGTQRQLTSGRHADGSPTFSPDGSRIAFTSNREDGSQVWTMPIDGGEPTRLTHFAPGVSDPVWSPDGKLLAVTAELWPASVGADGKVDEAVQKEHDAAYEKRKFEVHVADSLLYRHWTSWADGRRSHVLLVDAASGDVVRDATPGDWDAPTFSLGGDRGYAFSPDSKHLVFVSNHDEEQAGSTNADLWLVGVAGGEPTNLTADNHGWDGAPLFSPDGRYLGYVSQATAGYESDLRRLMVYDVEARQSRAVTTRESFDESVSDFTWAGEDALVFQADSKGRNPLYRVDVGGGEPRELHRHGSIDAWELLPDGAGAVYSDRSIGTPPELYQVAFGGEPRRLTQFNAALQAEVDIRPAEELWVRGDGDYDVQVFIVKPHGFDPSKRYPLILNVHGGPQSQWSDAYRGDWQVYPGKGYVVAFANPTGSTGRGQDYCDAISRDWGGRVFRDLMKVTDALAELPYVDASRMGSMGWSYGGYMMMWFQGHTDRFRCQAAMMGLYDLKSFFGATEELWFPEHDMGGQPWNSEDYVRWSPSSAVEEFRTPALVVTGELDYRVPYTQSLQYFSALQRRGVESRLVVFPGAGHWPNWREMMFYYNAHLDWFHRWLGGEPAPVEVMEHARGAVRPVLVGSGG